MEKISIIVPCYNEADTIPIFYKSITDITKTMNNVEFEYIFVSDGSSDGTLDVIKNFAESDNTVKYISFSRNFGKESAMYAGMKYASGDYIAIMDVDLQDPPELLPDMYDGIKNEGYDCVASRRINRKGEAKIRSFFARCFYRMINHISQTEIVDGARDFRMMSRQMTESILSLSEYNRFSKGIFSWVGYDTKWLEYENVERSAGETKWSFWKLFKYSVDGIVGFSTVPLAISSFFGVMLFLISIAGIIFVAVRQWIWGGSAYGWASTICILLLISGIQLFCTGVLGQYLAKAYLETKHRPIYITKETNIRESTEDEKHI